MKLKLALVALAVITAACGGDVEFAPTTTAAQSVTRDTVDDTGTQDMDMEDMDMGDTDAVPAVDAGGELVSGGFRVLESAPRGFVDVVGNADMARHESGTTVTISLENLIPAKSYVAHVHAGTCFDAGGPHYQFEVGASVMPPNEIHLAFTSLDDGTGFMTATNHQVAGPEATSVVIHEQTEDAPKIACADFG